MDTKDGTTMRRRIARGILLSAALTAASAAAGCSNYRETLGLAKNPPDEFRVVSREPLTMPPEYKLRPPEPGADRPDSRSARQQAEQTVFGGDGENGTADDFSGSSGMSDGEKAFLSKAGAQNANPDIRQLVARESDKLEAASTNFVDRLVFWQETRNPAEVVDPDEESKRLRENAALGKGVLEGETPTIERKERGFLEGIF